MASTFLILCMCQMAVGFLMFIFGLVDRISVKYLFSYIMFPIWVGILNILAGLSGILVANFYQRRGFLSPNMVSGFKAASIVCVGVCYFTFSAYTSTLAPLARDAAEKNIYGYTKIPLREGITSVIIILNFVEMFLGIWLAFFNEQGMFMSTPPIQHQRQQQQPQFQQQQVPGT